MLSTHGSQEREDEFSGFCLPGSTLSTDDHTLVPLTTLHEVVGIVSNGEDVWRLLPQFFILVSVDVSLVVDGEQLIRVDGHQDGAGVRLGVGGRLAMLSKLVHVEWQPHRVSIRYVHR